MSRGLHTALSVGSVVAARLTAPVEGLLHWLTKIDTESFWEKRDISDRAELRHCPAPTPGETSGYTELTL